jgi:hypothetical protein
VHVRSESLCATKHAFRKLNSLIRLDSRGDVFVHISEEIGFDDIQRRPKSSNTICMKTAGDNPWASAAGAFRDVLHVRFGSKADIASVKLDVRFTPKSGHCRATGACPLCAKRGHYAAQQSIWGQSPVLDTRNR